MILGQQNIEFKTNAGCNKKKSIPKYPHLFHRCSQAHGKIGSDRETIHFSCI